MYDVVFSRKAEQQLKKLEKTIQKRIISVLERSRIRPEAYFERMVEEKIYRLRAGDYRILADIDKKILSSSLLK